MRRLMAVVIFGLWLLSGCGRPTVPPREAAFASQVPFRVLPGLRLVSPQIVKYGKGYYAIVMGLENESGEYIWFPTTQHGARSFIYSESESRWVELEDREIGFEVEEILPPKGKEKWWFGIIRVAPILPPDVQPPVTIRVVVVGKIYRDGKPTDEEVGTYLDVTLPP